MSRAQQLQAAARFVTTGAARRLQTKLTHARFIVNKFVRTRQSFHNREGFNNFDFSLSDRSRPGGVSAMLRVKNEEDKIYYCLSSILHVFDEIVFVDNDSNDRTLSIVRDFKNREDRSNKVRIYFYPFKIARCGPEHFATPEDSVHNLAYYYNWTLSKCSFNYVCKWDGDMVLKKDRREAFANFLKQAQKTYKIWNLVGQGLYRDARENYFLATGETNSEVRLFPNGLNPRFHKIDLFEVLKCEPPLDEDMFEGVLFYELRFVTTDEFSHWSITDIPTERKRREMRNFVLIKSADISPDRFEKLPADFLERQVGRPVTV